MLSLLRWEKGDHDPEGRISDRREEHHFAPKAQISFSFAVGKRCCLTANDVMLRINDVATIVANATFPTRWMRHIVAVIFLNTNFVYKF